MSSAPLPKTHKKTLSRLRDILKVNTSHTSSPGEIDITNDDLGFPKKSSHDDTLSARSVVSGTQTAAINDTSPTSRISPGQQQSLDAISEPKRKTSDKLKKGLSVAVNGLETALRLLERSADALPPLKSFVGGLVAFLDLGEAVAENDEEYENLATELTNIAETLARNIPVLAVEGISDSITRTMDSINTELTHIKQQQDRNKTARIITAIQDQRDVIQRYRRISSLFRQLQSDISLRNCDNIRKLRETGLLKDMSPVYEARYDSGYSTIINRGRCAANTREKVLEDLKNWVGDPDGAKVYWMNGIAGTGKTTISYTLCEWLKEHSQLGGNYFCSRASALCRNVNSIVPTLAHQLAQYSPSFRSILCKVLEEEPEVCKLNGQLQFQKLIQRPLKAMKTAMPDNVVIVIDALDECDDDSAFRLFLGTLLKLGVNLPIKFFITSRPESAIHEKMLASEYLSSVLYLHDIEESVVGADIHTYLTGALGHMSPPPSSNEVAQLAKRAGKLFIHAATAIRYIRPGDSDVDSKTRLQTMLGISFGPTKPYDDLDELYISILSAAVSPKRYEPHEINDIQLILRTVVCTKEPVAPRTISSLLGIAEERVRSSLQPLRSVLHMGEDAQELVAPFHASFSDFIFGEPRSEDQSRFHCERTVHNEVLTNHCFRLMQKQLRFNICKLESSFLFDKDVSDLPNRIKSSISPALYMHVGTGVNIFYKEI